jgi:hypothetical protein
MHTRKTEPKSHTVPLDSNCLLRGTRLIRAHLQDQGTPSSRVFFSVRSEHRELLIWSVHLNERIRSDVSKIKKINKERKTLQFKKLPFETSRSTPRSRALLHLISAHLISASSKINRQGILCFAKIIFPSYQIF